MRHDRGIVDLLEQFSKHSSVLSEVEGRSLLHVVECCKAFLDERAAAMLLSTEGQPILLLFSMDCTLVKSTVTLTNTRQRLLGLDIESLAAVKFVVTQNTFGVHALYQSEVSSHFRCARHAAPTVHQREAVKWRNVQSAKRQELTFWSQSSSWQIAEQMQRLPSIQISRSSASSSARLSSTRRQVHTANMCSLHGRLSSRLTRTLSKIHDDSASITQAKLARSAVVQL